MEKRILHLIFKYFATQHKQKLFQMYTNSKLLYPSHQVIYMVEEVNILFPYSEFTQVFLFKNYYSVNSCSFGPTWSQMIKQEWHIFSKAIQPEIYKDYYCF